MIEVYKKPCPVDILAIGVHPDDIELSCSGTVLKHLEQGYTVGIADLTQGELGTRGNATLRLEESALAAQVQGVAFRVNLGMQDGFFAVDNEHLLSIIKLIRLTTPSIILANAVEDRHPDHGRASELVKRAFFYAGLAKIETGDLAHHRSKFLYKYIQDKNLTPDLCVDVTSTVEKKMEAIACFKSQFYTADDKGPATPISSKEFMEFIRAKMAVFGRNISVPYAEGFNVHRTPGCDDLFKLI